MSNYWKPQKREGVKEIFPSLATVQKPGGGRFIRPGTKTGAKSVNYWQHKASIARFKAATTDLKATTRKINVAMDKAGTAMEKKIKWYQKAANKQRYSKDFYKGKK